jgi:hypothetical protein
MMSREQGTEIKTEIYGAGFCLNGVQVMILHDDCFVDWIIAAMKSASA